MRAHAPDNAQQLEREVPESDQLEDGRLESSHLEDGAADSDGSHGRGDATASITMEAVLKGIPLESIAEFIANRNAPKHEDQDETDIVGRPRRSGAILDLLETFAASGGIARARTATRAAEELIRLSLTRAKTAAAATLTEFAQGAVTNESISQERLRALEFTRRACIATLRLNLYPARRDSCADERGPRLSDRTSDGTRTATPATRSDAAFGPVEHRIDHSPRRAASSEVHDDTAPLAPDTDDGHGGRERRHDVGDFSPTNSPDRAGSRCAPDATVNNPHETGVPRSERAYAIDSECRRPGRHPQRAVRRMVRRGTNGTNRTTRAAAAIATSHPP